MTQLLLPHWYEVSYLHIHEGKGRWWTIVVSAFTPDLALKQVMEEHNPLGWTQIHICDRGLDKPNHHLANTEAA